MYEKLLITSKNNKKYKFYLKKNVFKPTGTTVAIIDSLYKIKFNSKDVLDLGCGCGVLSVAMKKLNLCKGNIFASDISFDSIEATKVNAKLHKVKINAKCGELFNPWKNLKFDLIVNDVAGISKKLSKISSWYNNVPCETGVDGTLLTSNILKNSSKFLKKKGKIIFPIISLSNKKKILKIAKQNFKNIKLIHYKEFPLPKTLLSNIKILENLEKRGITQLIRKFGLVLFSTEIYCAYND